MKWLRQPGLLLLRSFKHAQLHTTGCFKCTLLNFATRLTFHGQLSAQTESHKSSVNPFPITYDAGFSWWSRRDGLVIQCPNTSLSRLFKQCLAQYCKYRTASKSNTPVLVWCLESPQRAHCIRIAFLGKKTIKYFNDMKHVALFYIVCVLWMYYIVCQTRQLQ